MILIMVSANIPNMQSDEIVLLEKDAELPSQENAKEFRCLWYAVSNTSPPSTYLNLIEQNL